MSRDVNFRVAFHQVKYSFLLLLRRVAIKLHPGFLNRIQFFYGGCVHFLPFPLRSFFLIPSAATRAEGITQEPVSKSCCKRVKACSWWCVSGFIGLTGKGFG